MRQGSGVLLLHLPGELAEDHAHDAEQALLGGMAQHLAMRHLQAHGMRRETRNVKPTCLFIFLASRRRYYLVTITKYGRFRTSFRLMKQV
jgi:hypothetical protein